MLSLLPPIANMRAVLGSRFGRRTDPVTGKAGAWHNGIDLRVPEGTELHSLSDGVVTFAGPLASSPDSGIALGVRAADAVSWSFSHLSAVLVSPGDSVRAGQVVARSGNTGKSTGPHLHLVVRRAGREVDPVPLLLPSGAGLLAAGIAAAWWLA
ncbi:MAG: M23 family metallopeptidase [Deltaproteobacteria bacterium]|nr:M23 family metallopeptidase [Deltaproteobacteria bacterium]